jgi:hypothetical protein
MTRTFSVVLAGADSPHQYAIDDNGQVHYDLTGSQELV